MKPQQLYPIRIDVTSSDRQLRLVDTLLWDPSVTLVSSSGGDAAVLVDQLALEILRDAVVLGVSRSARHFTNRLEIAETGELQQKISQQMAEQFRVMYAIEHAAAAAAAAAAVDSTAVAPLDAAVKSDAAASAIACGENDDSPTNPAKRRREDEDTKTRAVDGEDANELLGASPMQGVEVTSSSVSDIVAGATQQEENPPKKPRIETEDGAIVADNKMDNNSKLVSLSAAATKSSQSNLIPIHLRLLVHGVRIHDDFDYDPAVLSPLQLAQSIATDLQLTPEMIVAIAIDIAEQVAASHHPIVLSDDCRVVEQDEGGPQDRRNLTAAWMLPHRVHVTNVAHLVAQHRPLDLVLPTATTTTGNAASSAATGSGKK